MPNEKRPGFEDHETPTLVQCLACGGDWRKLDETDHGYRVTTCPWCTAGGQTAAQVARWHAHRQGRPR